MICVARFWHIVHVYHKKDDNTVEGLEIRSSVFRVNCSFFVIKSAKEQFPNEMDEITPVALF